MNWYLDEKEKNHISNYINVKIACFAYKSTRNHLYSLGLSAIPDDLQRFREPRS